MKRVFVIMCVMVMVAAASNAYASSAVDRYIQAIAALASPASAIPKPPKGYGAVRNEGTGDFLLLVPQEYCGQEGRNGDTIPLGRTTYGSRINGYCVEF